MKAWSRQEYWRHHILPWEWKNYDQPHIWPWQPIRARLHLASKLLGAELREPCDVLELGCGSGRLAELLKGRVSRYRGLDFACQATAQARKRIKDQRDFYFEDKDILQEGELKANIVIALGFLDWLSPEELDKLFAALNCRLFLFSYTEKGSTGLLPQAYGWFKRFKYRHLEGDYPRQYSQEQITTQLVRRGFQIHQTLKNRELFAGRLVLARQEGPFDP